MDVMQEHLKCTVDAMCTCDYLLPSSVKAFASVDHEPGCRYTAFLKRAASLVDSLETKAVIAAAQALLDTARTEYEDTDWRVDQWILDEPTVHALDAALAPFKDGAQ